MGRTRRQNHRAGISIRQAKMGFCSDHVFLP
jgi:hypothetical protein